MSPDLVPVFVYGTLTDPGQVDELLEDWRFDGPAILEGLHRVDGTYPTLAPGGRTAGQLLLTPQLAVLDQYEGVESGLYTRVQVPVVGGRTAWVYVGDPVRLDAPAAWPGDGPFPDRVTRHLDDAAVRVRPQ